MKGRGTNQLFSVLFSPTILLGITGVGILVFMASMWHRFIYIDDAFFGEQSFWLAKEGVVKTATLIDFLGSDHRLFSYHKLNIFIGALLIKVFGWSVNPLRFATLIFLIGFLWVLYSFFKDNKAWFSRDHLIVTVFIILFNPLIVLYAFTFRPEIWVMFFGFSSYWLLEKSFVNVHAQRILVLSGMLAGLAFLTHLNGLIFSVAGLMVLVLAKKWKGALIFSMSSGIICLLYFFDLWQEGHFEMWLYQIKNWPDNNATNYLSDNFFNLFLNIMIKLSEEHQRFFWSDRVWAISAFFLLALIPNFKYLFRQHTHLMVYILTLILTLNIAGSQIAERYLIYFFPFMAIIIAIDIIRMKEKSAYIRKWLYAVLLILQLIFVTKMFVGIFQKNNNHTKISKGMLSEIPDKTALTLVPYTFIFNELENYNLASFKAFEYYQVSVKHPLTQQEFFTRAATLNIKYIVVPLKGLKYTDTGLPCLDSGAIDKNEYYTEYDRNERCAFFVRK